MIYTPDKWLEIKINSNQPHYRVFACWYGGYASGDSWKLNSGITSIKETKNTYEFGGTSGSIYSCNKKSYGSSLYGSSVLSSIINDCEKQSGITVDILPENTDFTNLKYETH